MVNVPAVAVAIRTSELSYNQADQALVTDANLQVFFALKTIVQVQVIAEY